MINRPHKRMRLTPICAFLSLILNTHQYANAEDIFDINALETGSSRGKVKNVDLSQFSTAGGQVPGEYRVDVLINNEPVDTRTLPFVIGKQGLQPLLTVAMLRNYNVKIDAIPGLKNQAENEPITDLANLIPQASTRLDFNNQRLLISIPQAYMGRMAQGEVNSSQWDDGIPALIMGYDLNGANSWQDTTSNDASGNNNSYFLNLRTGLNFGAWRLRNYSTWTYDDHRNTSSQRNRDEKNDNTDQQSASHWNSINTFVQRDIPVIKGVFTLGDTATPSDVFDGVLFRGAQVASNDDMLPDSQRNFAPTVRGIANSNAKVTVRQNNTVIYQAYVPPGPFVINDLYPNSTNGDLIVTITEAGGQEHTFTQAFSSVAIMQREGHLKYAVTAGKYRSDNNGKEPEFGQMSFIYGLPRDVTVYNGIQTSEDYNAILVGTGLNLFELGSLSLDATYAATNLTDESKKEGQSYRLQYSKSMLSTGSTLTLAAYRYSTSGFYTFQETNELRRDNDNDQFNINNQKRSRLQLNISQNLMGGNWGTLYLTGYQQDYWGQEGYQRNLSMGYNTVINKISYGLTYSYTTSPNSEINQQLAFTVSIPLSKWLPDAWAGYNLNTDKSGNTTQQATLYGTALEDNNLSYNFTEGYGSHGAGNTGSMSADYRGSKARVNAGYNYGPDNRQLNYGIQGAVVVHPYGVTLSQPISGDIQSLALVRAPGLKNAKIQNSVGVSTDSRGYAIVPYLGTYRRSTISIDTQSLGDSADIDTNTAQVIPTAGSVVLADFKTRIGARVLMTLTKNGEPLPFGITVTLIDDENTSTGIVGDKGEVYLSGVPQSGTLKARWGNSVNQQCTANYRLPAANNDRSTAAILRIKAHCQ